MTKLTRLKIIKFRNVEPVELKFSAGMNVLLGINGSGKTTFLELIANLLGQNESVFSDEEIEVEYDLEFEHAGIQIRLEKQHAPQRDATTATRFRGSRAGGADVRVNMRINLRQSPLEYSVESNRSATTVMLRDGSSEVLKSEFPFGVYQDEHFLSIALAALQRTDGLRQDSATRSIQAAIDPLIELIRFDESLEFFETLLDDDGWIESLGDSATPEARLEFWSDWRASESLNNSLWKAACGNWPSWKESQTILLAAREIPWLESLLHLTGLKDAKLELRLVSKRPYELGGRNLTLLQFGMLRFWFEKIDGTIIPEQKLSYGQKRLLSFLYYVDCNPHIIIADELANGLHHAWITACIEAIGDRQAFLASQNPLLLDEINLSSVEDVERSFILCRCDTSTGKERLVWSNMSRYDAERFFEAYNVGLQHVSEILRTKRLW